MKEISIVVASQNAETTIGACLTSLEAQNRDGVAEIIVVDNSCDGTAQIVEADHHGLQLVKIGGPALIPHLWAEGAKRASGDVVAFTTAHFVPDTQWLTQNLRHHRSEYAAVGGAGDGFLVSSSMLQEPVCCHDLKVCVLLYECDAFPGVTCQRSRSELCAQTTI